MKGNPEQIKEKIISLITQKGPSIPIHLSRELEMDTIFTSAFLSELVSNKQLKISQMKVGGSPIYFLPNQEEKLESYGHQHLKGVEKEAFLLLQKNKFLKSSEQNPAIRVALAYLKDFAKQEEKSEGLYWKYFTYKGEIPSKKTEKETTPIQKVEIFDKPQETGLQAHPGNNSRVGGGTGQKRGESSMSLQTQTQKPKLSPKKKTTRKTSNKANEKFFSKVKEHLFQKGIQILEIEGFSKNDLTLKIKQQEKTLVLIAFNKKRVDEKDIIKAHQKAKELNLSYKIICLGDQTKKLNEFIIAVKDLESIGKIE